jgi:putative phosphoesterase
MDPALGEDYLPIKQVIEIEGVKIGISHGEGSPHGIENRLLYTFEEDNVDIIIFGHTHKPFWGVIGGVHFLNPGSPTNKRSEQFHTYAVLTVEDGKFHAEIKRV